MWIELSYVVHIFMCFCFRGHSPLQFWLSLYETAEISPLKGDSQAPSLDIPTTSQPMKTEQVFNEIFK